MSIQVLTLKLDGITAGDYLTWCRDPDPPALDFGLRSIRVSADPLGDTITAILDWNQPPPAAPTAATAAGLPLSVGVQIHPQMPTGAQHTNGDQRFVRELSRDGVELALTLATLER
jgi:hypothetical protein